MPGIGVVSFICDSEGCHPDSVKVLKIVKWPPCVSIAEARAFIEVCVYYRIWISGFAHIAVPIYYLFRDGVLFKWARCQQKTMDLLKEQLTTVPVLKSIDYHGGAGDIVLAVDASGHGWGAVLMQYAAGSKRKRHPIRYESGVWSPQEAAYDAG